MVIRLARPEDLPAICAIEEKSFAHPWPEELLAAYLGEKGCLVLVAEEREVIGFLIACCERSGGRAVFHVHDLATAPESRRQGVATALLEDLIRSAIAARVSSLRLEVRPQNEAALRFYARHGFETIRRIYRYYEDGGDALRMELDLHPSGL